MPDNPKDSPEFQALVRKVVLRTFGQERHTQDSPVLPDVWIAYAAATPDKRVDVILTPRTGSQPGLIAKFLRERISENDPDGEARIAAIRNAVSAKLTFEELLTRVIPMTDWWPDVCRRLRLAGGTPGGGAEPPVSGDCFLEAYVGLPDSFRWEESVMQVISRYGIWDFYRFVALAGFVRCCQDTDADWETLRALAEGLVDPGRQLDNFMRIINAVTAYVEAMADSMDAIAEAGQGRTIWSVACNRKASLTVAASGRTVKADAARTLFGISASDITWAVVDSGIDASHPAFDDRQAARTAAEPAGNFRRPSRVTRTYDFTWLRDLLATGQLAAGLGNKAVPSWVAYNRKAHAALLEKLKARRDDGDGIDWDLIEPLIRIPHDPNLYAPPIIEHGTHVAGIIGGDWKSDENPEGADLLGMAPDIRFIDIRVFAEHEGGGDEFTVVSALQFLMHLNRRRDLPVVHGVNLSLSLVHDVKSFACGQTPICQECNRLGSNGMVLVAAAGNRGLVDGTGDGSVFEAYCDISITDPGNADGVITVGATHRSEPHTYGVSYFSSRGPTGDGRRKPDLVAPGEKIVGPTPGGGVRRMDGTSMAAPHVSGAAALLMARHREFVGQPRAIKDILCKTATDLGREAYFQGAGLVDILRALQSV
ncbi:S8 family peptidase [Solidesulfovibrio sp.]